ncbi:MAG TPA: hypothetical protein VFR24_21230 [Candidatus Angelobacter sp.]|nr:hypothetical protein [Candidatus Angelobacter sp.]
MSLDKIRRLIKEWQPGILPTELKYRDSLTTYLREALKGSKIENEYRHEGTTIDIHIKISGFFSDTQVFIELKRNLLQKAQFDRLVGQVESLKPSKNSIIVVLCGDSNPGLVERLKEKYSIGDPFLAESDSS